MPEIASMCVSLENESERATVIKYIPVFNCLFCPPQILCEKE